MAKAGFMKDAAILFVITLIAGIGLGGVFGITKKPIEIAKENAKLKAYQSVLPDAAAFPSDGMEIKIAEAAEAVAGAGFGKVQIDEAAKAMDASGNLVGYVVSATSKEGFSGTISITVGFDLEGTVTKIEYLTLAETPGLGMNAQKPEFKDQYQGKAVEAFRVTKKGASAEDEIDAMSGATVTSNAVTGAVNAAVYFKDHYLE